MWLFVIFARYFYRFPRRFCGFSWTRSFICSTDTVTSTDRHLTLYARNDKRGRFAQLTSKDTKFPQVELSIIRQKFEGQRSGIDIDIPYKNQRNLRATKDIQIKKGVFSPWKKGCACINSEKGVPIFEEGAWKGVARVRSFFRAQKSK